MHRMFNVRSKLFDANENEYCEPTAATHLDCSLDNQHCNPMHVYANFPPLSDGLQPTKGI